MRHALFALLALAAASAAPDLAVPGPARAGEPAGIGPEDLLLIDAATWGANARTVADYARLGRARWLAAQLRPDPEAGLPPAVQALSDATPGAGKPAFSVLALADERSKATNALTDPEEKKTAQAANQTALNDAYRGAMSREVFRALYAPDALREKLSWFWFNHFNVGAGKALGRALVGDYLETAIRPRALGRFRDLLLATLKHPAMLRYLDNVENAAGRPNENYARELMELHTMGVGSGYTQADVETLARILSGAGISAQPDNPKLKPELAPLLVRDGAFLFNPARHEGGDKVLLGHRIPAGGFDEIEAAVLILSREPATARHVSRDLAVFFAGDDPPEALVAAMAETFRRSDGDIAAVLGTMFERGDFLPARRAHGFKSPVAFVFSALRLAYDDRPILNAGPAIGWLNRLGEGLFNHSTPDGYPLGSGSWTGPGQMTARFEVARQIGSGPAGLFKGADGTDRPGYPVLQNELYFTVLRNALAPATRTALEAATSPQDWNTLYLSSPDFMR